MISNASICLSGRKNPDFEVIKVIDKSGTEPDMRRSLKNFY